MYKIEIDSPKFKQLIADSGLSANGLAKLINSNTVQMWRLTCGRYTTSTAFLYRLVPVFGLKQVADLITNPTQRSAFLAMKPRRISVNK